jgi:hypothetical protein
MTRSADDKRARFTEATHSQDVPAPSRVGADYGPEAEPSAGCSGATPRAADSLRVVPISVQDAKPFVGKHHRHNKPPQSGMFAVALSRGDKIVGVGIASRPVARALQDGTTLEVTRVCTLGDPNACSMIYGALRKAARALGYRRVFTYTLAEEGGASLRAAGFVKDADVPARAKWTGRVWKTQQRDLFGNETRPPGPKIRWVWRLTT